MRRSGRLEDYSARSLYCHLLRLTLLGGCCTLFLFAYFVIGRASLSALLPQRRILVETVCSEQFLEIKAEELERKLLAQDPGAVKNPAGHQPVAECQAHENIVLLKVHKCASSALQNILLRYGEAHNLTLVLPPKDNYLGHRDKFAPDMALPLPSTQGTQYNLLCHHTRFHRQNMAGIMPNDTVYISSLKEPAAMFESAYDFFGLAKRYGVNLTQFIQRPHWYYNNETIIQSRFARNPMMFDFGLEMEDFDNQSKIDAQIAELEDRFSLVMITEEMDESLVLLRDLLCWKWSDVVTFRVNKRSDSRVLQLRGSVKKRIRAWNNADTQLYRHFLATFQRKKKAYGLERLARDVAKLRRMSDLWRHRCENIANTPDATTQQTLDDEEYRGEMGYEEQVRRVEHKCSRMKMRELTFTSLIRDQLWPPTLTLATDESTSEETQR